MTEIEYQKALKVVNEYEAQQRLNYDLYTIRVGQKLQLIKDPDTKNGQLTKGNVYEVSDNIWSNIRIRDNHNRLFEIARSNANLRWIRVD